MAKPTTDSGKGKWTSHVLLLLQSFFHHVLVLFETCGFPLELISPFLLNLTGATISKEATATISAKPQLRNTQAELTKLVPTALRVKRDQPKNKPKLRPPGAGPEAVESIPQQVSQPRVAETGTKDDAYALFMKEMEGFL